MFLALVFDRLFQAQRVLDAFIAMTSEAAINEFLALIPDMTLDAALDSMAQDGSGALLLQEADDRQTARYCETAAANMLEALADEIWSTGQYQQPPSET